MIQQTRTGSGAGPSVNTQLSDVYADHLDTPRVIVRQSDHAAVWRWDQAEAYGNAAPHQNPTGLGTFVYNPRFPGQLHDPESNLSYNLHRSYRPPSGSYTQSDPIGLAGGISTYTYVENRPTMLTDPLGLDPWWREPQPPSPGAYGTQSCAYYSERCRTDGGLYYCNIAPSVCARTPDSRWTRCVRKCLQDTDRQYCEPKDKNTCGGSDLPCVVNIHQMCWQECISQDVPPSAQPGP